MCGRQIVHLVPASSVFAPGSTALIGLLEGPSSKPQPLELALRVAAADGSADAGAAPLVQKQVPAAANRLVLLSIPTVSRPLVWESSFRCDADEEGDEFGFITHLPHRPSACWCSRVTKRIKSCSSSWPA